VNGRRFYAIVAALICIKDAARKVVSIFNITGWAVKE
jgi:hypothetical protein